jgi:predicted dehydrogenase
MASAPSLRLGVVGCGHVAERYVSTMRAYTQLELVGVADIRPDVCAAFAKAQELHAYRSFEDLLADRTIDIVVDLTAQDAHADVVTRCLEAGKHVYAEKPLALNYARARQIIDLASRKHVRLACAPCTFMGEGQQTAWRIIREGRLGEIRLVYAETNHSRPETFHPSPEAFLDVGPLFDVGPYNLTMLATVFGPAARVRGYGRLLLPERQLLNGEIHRPAADDAIFAIIEYPSMPVVRFTVNYYVDWFKRQMGIEFHGDKGSLFLSTAMYYGGSVEFAEFGRPYESVPLLKQPFPGMDFGRGVADLVDAIMNDRPHRASAEQAAHIIETMEAILESARTGLPVELKSTFTPPQPEEWAL